MQITLNRLYEGPEFDISFWSAQAITFIFVVLMYCGAVPLMIPVCFIYLILRYWVDKYQVLKFYKKPPRYEANIFDIQMILIWIAIIFHLAFSLWIYTNQQIFPTKVYFESNS